MDDTFVVFISMNHDSKFNAEEENVFTALLSRVTWELSTR